MRPLILGLAGAVAATAVAHAQPPGPPPPAEMKAHMEAMQKQRGDDLRTVLRLGPEQDAALAAYLDAGKPPEMGEPPGPPEALTTPQRLDRMAKRDAEVRGRMDRRRQALATFYVALSPEQQKTFDALQRLQGPGLGGPRLMLRGRGPGPMPPPGAEPPR